MENYSSRSKANSTSLPKKKIISKLKLKSYSNLNYLVTEPDQHAPKKKKLTLNLIKTKKFQNSKYSKSQVKLLMNINRDHSNNSNAKSDNSTIPAQKIKKDYATLLNENRNLRSQIEKLKQENLVLKTENKKLYNKLSSNTITTNTASHSDILHLNPSSSSNILLTQDSLPSFLKQNKNPPFIGYFKFKQDNASPTLAKFRKKKIHFHSDYHNNIETEPNVSDNLTILNQSEAAKELTVMKIRVKKILNQYSTLLGNNIRIHSLTKNNYNTIEAKGNSRNIKLNASFSSYCK